MNDRARKEPPALLLLAAACLAVSGIGSYDPFTWFLEVLPILVVAPLLVATHRRFPLTPMLYRLIFLHALILMLGAHYTYERVPLGLWVQHWLGAARNHYDRLGHFTQGFVPAVAAREVLLRCSPLRPSKMLSFLTVCVCLAVSATYELGEWWAAVLFREGAEAFLGTQGDVWDTQWDMCLALIGASAALLLLSRLHDRALTRLLADADQTELIP